MPQTQYDHKVADKAAADTLVANTEGVQGVKFVNVNVEAGTVVVTHGDDFDEATFRAKAGI